MTGKMKFHIYFIFLVCFLLSCEQITEKKQKTIPVKLSHNSSQTVEIPLNPLRVISLLPSQTECLAEIIDTSQIIAISTQCDFPVQLCTYKRKISSYPPDIEAIVSLKPDLVVTLKGLTNAATIKRLQDFGIQVYAPEISSLKDIQNNYSNFGYIFNLKQKTDSIINQKLALNKNNIAEKGNYLFLFSPNPLYCYGENNFLDEIFNNNGFKNIASYKETHSSYPILNREFILEKNPEYLFLTKNSMKDYLLKIYPEFKKINAIKNNKVFLIPEDYCSRPTSRIYKVDSILNSIK